MTPANKNAIDVVARFDYGSRLDRIARPFGWIRLIVVCLNFTRPFVFVRFPINCKLLANVIERGRRMPVISLGGLPAAESRAHRRRKRFSRRKRPGDGRDTRDFPCLPPLPT